MSSSEWKHSQRMNNVLFKVVKITVSQKSLQIPGKEHSKTGVGKLFVWRATFEKNVARHTKIGKFITLSLQNRKVYSLCKKTHIHIQRSFCISLSGSFNAIYTVVVRTETYTIFMKFYSSSKTL